MTYASTALRNITSMTVGAARDEHWNLFWHWVKHAQPVLAYGRVVAQPEMAGIPSEARYLELAQSICAAAARGDPGTEVKLCERPSGHKRHKKDGLWWQEWAIWYQPSGAVKGLFVKVRVVGNRGEIKTMFPPERGRDYFDDQQGVAVH